MSDGVFGKFEQIGPIRVSPYVGPEASAEPKGVSGLRIAYLTAIILFPMVFAARFTILGILNHPSSALYQQTLPGAFILSLLFGLYLWAFITALLGRKAPSNSAEPLFVRPKEVPSHAVLAVARLRDMAGTKGWTWIQSGKLWFSSEQFWFCLGPSDFTAKMIFGEHGTALKLPRGLCLRQVKLKLYESNGTFKTGPAMKQFRSKLESELYDEASSRAPSVFPPLSVPSKPVNWRRVWMGSTLFALFFAVLMTSVYFILPEFDGFSRTRILGAIPMMVVIPLLWPLLIWGQGAATNAFAKDEARFRKNFSALQ